MLYTYNLFCKLWGNVAKNMNNNKSILNLRVIYVHLGFFNEYFYMKIG